MQLTVGGLEKGRGEGGSTSSLIPFLVMLEAVVETEIN